MEEKEILKKISELIDDEDICNTCKLQHIKELLNYELEDVLQQVFKNYINDICLKDVEDIAPDEYLFLIGFLADILALEGLMHTVREEHLGFLDSFNKYYIANKICDKILEALI